MRDYIVVAYRRGSTMRRRIDGEWISETFARAVSLLTRAAESHWVWPADIEVVHVYLTQDELTNTCRQMYEETSDVELHDVVKANNPAIHRTAMLIAHEAAQGAAGSRLMVDSLSCQLSVHILRRHAHVLFRDNPRSGRAVFSPGAGRAQLRHERLQENISLEDLAGTVGLSRYHFPRRFRQSTGTTPHEFVLQQRVGRAKTLLHAPTRRCSTSPASVDSPTRAT